MTALDEQGVRDVLDAQVAAWNRGDLDGFMSLCADDVTYLAGDGPRVGRERVHASYRHRYPQGDMGTLSLAVLQVDVSGDRAVAVARWGVDGQGGHALLVFKATADGWRLAWDATLSR